MNLNELRDRAYKTACDHGFHDEELSNEHCLCLVISELMEAVEADRKGKRANVDWYNKKIANSRICQGLVPGTPKEIGFEVAYNETIKGSIEEELADAVIRLLDLCGLRKIDIEDFTEEMLYGAEESCNDETFTESIYAISTIPIRYEYEYDCPLEGQLNGMLLAIFGLAKHLDIDLIWHINQKMRYNELRENKHGKKVLIMKEIEMYPGVDIDYAYEQLKKFKQETGEDCFCKFNDKELYSSEALDEMYLKVTRKTKAEFDKDFQDKHNEYLRREAEFHAKIPQLTIEYRQRARGIIPNKHLEYWDKIVPIRLNDLYKGFELDCLLKLISELNTDKPQEERFKNCLQMFIDQGHSGMSASLIFSGLSQFHDLGSQLVDYIKKH